jgi:D-alanyl-D-alanine carboxypeptidase
MRRTTVPLAIATIVAVGATLASVLGYWSLGASPSSSTDGRGRQLGLPQDDGGVPDGVTVFDDEYAAVARLSPGLRGALRRASTAAGEQGVRLFVNSGWRSTSYQARLFDEAVETYGSEPEAARWVARPETSAHVSGDAVDIGPAGAAGWLSAHGAAYGLCQTFTNEPWHFELRPKARSRGCPPPTADASHLR